MTFFALVTETAFKCRDLVVKPWSQLALHLLQACQSSQVQKSCPWQIRGQAVTSSVALRSHSSPPHSGSTSTYLRRLFSPAQVVHAPHAAQTLSLQSFFVHVSGQACRPHAVVSASVPLQSSPPCVGSWRMARVRVLWPPPHVLEQSPHFCHSPTLQSLTTPSPHELGVSPLYSGWILPARKKALSISPEVPKVNGTSFTLLKRSVTVRRICSLVILEGSVGFSSAVPTESDLNVQGLPCSSGWTTATPSSSTASKPLFEKPPISSHFRASAVDWSRFMNLSIRVLISVGAWVSASTNRIASFTELSFLTKILPRCPLLPATPLLFALGGAW
mmetsp:Transcript_25045/g.69789  ORF Transcript_25045/g.69789 Transcript_25045/m.69789 type:complete len:332 (-) Transcript_25045:1919-2914(-)